MSSHQEQQQQQSLDTENNNNLAEDNTNNIANKEVGDDEVQQPTYFIEKQEVIEIIDFLCANFPKKHDTVIETPNLPGCPEKQTTTSPEKLQLYADILKKMARFEKIIGEYQEFSQLLKPHLDQLAVPLINLFASLIPQTNEQLNSIRDKAIQGFFAQEQQQQQLLLQKQQKQDPSCANHPDALQNTSPLRGVQQQQQNENNNNQQRDAASPSSANSPDGAGNNNTNDDDDNDDENENDQQQQNNNKNTIIVLESYGEINNDEKTSNAALKVDSRLGQDFEEYEIDAERTTWHQAARLVTFVCKVIGFKSVIGFFPHDVKMLETCFRALQAWMRHPQARAEWEVRYCLLLWLSNLILVPFALNNIDSSAAVGSLSSALLETALTFLGDSSKCREGAALFIGRLLTRPDAEGHRSRLMQEAIVEMNVLASTGLSSHVRAGGVLHAAAITFKTGCREELIGFARMLIPIVAPVTLKSGDARVCKTATKLLQRLGLALLPNKPQPWRYNKARTVFLGQQNLATKEASEAKNQQEQQKNQNNNKQANDEDDDEESLSLAHLQQIEEVVDVLISALGHQDTMVRYSAAKGLGRICERLPRDCADDIVSAVMDLDDGPFAVRENDSNWHGATLALAEICRRYALLPSRFSQLVPLVEKALTYDVCKGSYSVGSHVRDAASYICWAAARSYNTEDLVDYVTPLSRALVTTALTDREVNVRRAASAAFQECAGRLGNFPNALDIITTVDFYALANLRNALLEVAPKIAWIDQYRTALFDRLLNDRIEHWSKDVRETSAAALGLMCNSMVEFAENKDEMKKYITTTVISRLCKQALDSASVNVRHGSVCALADIVGRWKNRKTNTIEEEEHLCKSSGTELMTLIPHMEAKRLFRGRGAEFIRQACCKLIENVSIAQLTVTDKITRPGLRGNEDVSMRATMQAFFEETCKNPLRWLQRDGASAMKAFGETFYPTYNEKFHSGVVSRLVQGCASNKTPNERRGSCLMLGALPASVLYAPVGTLAAGITSSSSSSPAITFVTIFDLAVEILCKAAIQQKQQQQQQQSATTALPASIAAASTAQAEGEDAECREEAIRALGRMCVTALKKDAPSSSSTTPFVKNFSLIETTFLNATNDYATDRRGDIGLFVRLASIESYRETLETLIITENHNNNQTTRIPSFASLTSSHLSRFVNACFQQSMEKIDRVRSVTTKQIHHLVENALVDGNKLRKQINDVLSTGSESNINNNVKQDFEKLVQIFHNLKPEHDFAAPSASFDLIVPNLISCPTFTQSLIDGLCASAGCLTPHVAQSALDSMIAAVSPSSSSSSTKSAIAKCIFASLEKFKKSERMCVSCLLMTERCLEKGIIVDQDILEAAVDFCFEALTTFAKDIQRTLALIPIFSSFSRRCCSSKANAQKYASARIKSWQMLLLLLATRFPKVRALASVELFTVLAALSDEVRKEVLSFDISIDDAQDKLTETKWDILGGATDELKQVRSDLYELLRVEAPLEIMKEYEAIAGAGSGKSKKQVSELAMYKTLVAEKGY